MMFPHPYLYRNFGSDFPIKGTFTLFIAELRIGNHFLCNILLLIGINLTASLRVRDRYFVEIEKTEVSSSLS